MWQCSPHTTQRSHVALTDCSIINFDRPKKHNYFQIFTFIFRYFVIGTIYRWRWGGNQRTLSKIPDTSWHNLKLLSFNLQSRFEPSLLIGGSLEKRTSMLTFKPHTAPTWFCWQSSFKHLVYTVFSASVFYCFRGSKPITVLVQDQNLFTCTYHRNNTLQSLARILCSANLSFHFFKGKILQNLT